MEKVRSEPNDSYKFVCTSLALHMFKRAHSYINVIFRHCHSDQSRVHFRLQSTLGLYAVSVSGSIMCSNTADVYQKNYIFPLQPYVPDFYITTWSHLKIFQKKYRTIFLSFFLFTNPNNDRF